jgi:hypothetical protein
MTADPTLTRRAVAALEPELPTLVGPGEWPALAAELAALGDAWAAAEDDVARMHIAARYRATLAPHDAARERLYRAERAASLSHAALLGAAALTAELGDADGAARLRTEVEAAEPRLIFESGVGRPAYSLKLANLEVRFWELALAAGGILSAVERLTDPTARPIALAGAALLIIGALGKTMAREIAVDDASVFLGLAAAAGANRVASLAAVRASANERRRVVYLPELSEQEVKRSLIVLHQLRAVAPVEGRVDVWRVVEDHGRV